MEIDLVSLYRALMSDLCVEISTRLYILKRLKNEGYKFVTVTLPSFAKHVLLCIEQGYWSNFGTNIRCRKGLPVIFQGYLTSLFVFDAKLNQWVLLDEPDPVSLYCLRQVCEYAFKLSIPFDDAVVEEATAKFVETDNSVLGCNEYDHHFVDSMRSNFCANYRRTHQISYEDLKTHARFGSGTYSGAGQGWWRKNHYPLTATRSTFDIIAPMRLNKHQKKPDIVAPDSRCSEVLFVPKDSRGPRVIVREPYHLLAAQLSFNSLASNALERDTNFRVNFQDQTINRELAHHSSIFGNYATIDLKDASDRVSFAIVSHLFRNFPIGSCLKFRVRETILPDGRRHPLKKLAGMGSGYTFPTMALVIHLAICTHVSKVLNVPYRRVMSDVYVYGDDIIVPTAWVELAYRALTFVGLEVNKMKSYSRGPFRESCGGDYLHGNDVTPARLRLSNSAAQAAGCKVTLGNLDSAVLQVERHARELVIKQLYSAADYLYLLLEKVLGDLPYVSGESEVLGRYVVDNSLLATLLPRRQDGTHLDVACWVVKPKKVKMLDACPFRYLRTKLAKVGCDTFDDKGSRTVSGLITVSIPRKVKLKKVKLSSLALI